MSTRFRSVVIHGHFYQPPREDPWLDEVEREPSAAPFHDWNQRIERECYRAVVAARVPGVGGRIGRIVNTLASISFDFGPTLLEWMEREAPETYAGVLAADRASRARHGGHGNAIAMPYHHPIFPLSSRRDKVTEVRWGLADFRRRYGREPTGMWLPETAVDDETLDVLAAAGVAFTILAPHQVDPVPAAGLPGRYRTSGGRTIALFVYDGAISHDVAFGPLLQDARAWAERLTAPGPPGGAPRLVAVATDGETYGHHHRFGEMALAAVLQELARRDDVRVENFAAFLARHAPVEDVALVAPTSWSCVHGVERWRGNCGCKVAAQAPTHQRWRAPLRAAVEWLASELHALFEREAVPLLGDPWAARDACNLPASADVRARELLELERNALRMFTSCGWFFDDLGGIESRQVLRYAARAIDFAGGEAPRLEAGFLDRLAQATSNDPAVGTGRDLYERQIKPRISPVVRVAGGYTAARSLTPELDDAEGGGGSRCYAVRADGDRITLTHRRTGRTTEFRVAVERPRLGRIAVVVRSPEDAAVTRLQPADFPERQQLAVATALRGALVARWLTADEITAAATAGIDLTQVTSRKLVGAVAALAHDDADSAITRVLDLADLLELLGLTVPFDVQTAFDRVRSAAAPGRARALEPVAVRLGFVPAPEGP
ncbi:MAG: DUF3536 domain-containing protein [Gemmatimonadetes bacterium]|nr:DUF3536 domain-containing protein [Gemmatimonadota bacterium]